MDKSISKRADNNLLEAVKTRTAVVKGAEIIENSKYAFFTIGVESEDGHLNGAICLDDDYAEEAFEKSKDYFRALKRSFSFWVRDYENEKLEAILLEKGYVPKRKPGSAAMAIYGKITGNQLKPGYSVEIVKSESQIRDFTDVISEAFSKERKVSNHMFSELETLNSDKCIAFLIYKDSVAVASALTVASKDTAGIYWIGVREANRREGLGAYIVETATNAGFERGASAVILQASEVGEKLYKKLGFETFKHYRLYTVKYDKR